MSYVEESAGLARPAMSQQATSLAHEWRRLTRAATAVAIFTAPAFFMVLFRTNGWSLGASLLVTFLAVIAFRGLVDVLAHKLIPQLEPALERPLTATLPAPPPTVNSVEESPEADVVKRMTGRNLFTYSFTQEQGLGVLLVLNRRPPQ